MYHAARVCMRERGAHIADDGQGVRPGQCRCPSRVQHPAEKYALQRFHGEKDDVAVAVEFMHPHDVRMRERLQMLEFELQFL